MKKLFSVLLCLFISAYFFTSCKKETVSTPEANSVSNSIAKKSAKEKSAKENYVPFKGTYEISVQFLSPPPAIFHIITGTGTATHLGASSFVAESTIYITPRPPFISIGTVIFTAANGDQLFANHTATSTPVAGAPNNVIVNYTITGGTGRFEDASGSLVGRPVIQPGSTTGTTAIEGNINY
ncbi:MAG: hypothetical protein ABR503_13950 [Chitinophagaceae bacterium]